MPAPSTPSTTRPTRARRNVAVALRPAPISDPPIEGLDSRVPLVLLPVRLETRFTSREGREYLRVRIYPDDVHMDAHVEDLTEAEQALAQELWRSRWADANGEDAEADWQALIAAVGPHRAVYVARRMKPTNWTEQGRTGEPAFPRRATPSTTDARLRGLPTRWCVSGVLAGNEVFRVWGAPVPADLPAGPSWGADGVNGGDLLALLRARGAGWLVDFDEAVRVGMALEIPLQGRAAPVARDGLDELLVVGARLNQSVEAGARELATLLEGHRYSGGLTFLRGGEPTNRSAGEASGTSGTPGLESLASCAWPDDRTLPPRTSLLALRRAFGIRAADGSPLPDVEGAADDLDAAPRAMNTLLWPATLKPLLETLLDGQGADLLSTTQLALLRDWFCDVVRPTGALPLIRVGDQPYGILPVIAPGVRSIGTVADGVLNVLARLRPAWEELVERAPALSEDAVAEEDDPAEELLAALALAPDAVEVEGVSFTLPGSGAYGGADATWRDSLSELDVLAKNIGGLLSLVERLRSARSLGEQATVAEDLSELVTRESASLKRREAALGPNTLENAQAYKALVPVRERLRDLARLSLVITGLVGARRKAAARLFTALGDPDAPVARLGGGLPLLALSEGDGPSKLTLVRPDTTASFLERCASWASKPTGPAPACDGSAPLLERLAAHAIQRASEGEERAALADALTVLAQVPSAPMGDGEPSSLERLLRAALGPISWRLDAWWTAAASHLLWQRRRSREGAQTGGYGCVFNLRRDAGTRPPGHLLAPSLDHAATAAVLRAGWDANRDDDGNAPLAVDLSSARVRGAREILDGLARGRGLGELLGLRAVRRMRAAGHEDWIRDLSDWTGQIGTARDEAPRDAPLDGLLLAQAWIDPTAPGGEALKRWAGQRQERRAGLDAIASDLDALADLAVAEGVFSLVTGAFARAGAILDAYYKGERLPPSPEVASLPAAGRRLRHRVVILMADPPAPGWPGASRSARAMRRPRLEGWVASVLGDPRRVVALARWEGGSGEVSEVRLTLVDLDLSALDLLARAPVSDGLAGSALHADLLAAACACAPAGAPSPASPTLVTAPQALAEGEVGLDDLLVLVRALQSLLGRCRPLVPSDLQLPEDADLGEGGKTLDIFANGGDDLDLIQLDPARHLAAVPASGGPEQVVSWISQASRVRADVAALHDVIGLSDALSPRPLLRLGAAQLPALPDEPWVAQAADPEREEGAAVSWVWCQAGGRDLTSAKYVSGLLVDEWDETVPALTARAGVALRWDAPAARAPQAILLALPQDGAPWTAGSLLATCREALALARLRAVGPEAAARWSPLLPALFLSQT